MALSFAKLFFFAKFYQLLEYQYDPIIINAEYIEHKLIL